MTILYLTHRLPYAPNRGDRIRSFHVLQRLRRFAEVHVFSLVDDETPDDIAGLRASVASLETARPSVWLNRARGTASLIGSRPLTHTLQRTDEGVRALRRMVGEVRPDVVFPYCSGMAWYAVDGPLRDVPCVVDVVDVDSEKWRQLGGHSAPPLKWVYQREARTLAAFEARACRHAATSLVVNEREREALARLAPGCDIRVIENGIDLEQFRSASGPASSAEVVFCGVMDYPPNVDAVLWFVRDIWPSVIRRVPGARFTIVGSRPSTAVQSLAASPSVTVTGSVPDVRPFLWRAAVSVAPLRTARGLQNKVLEALAAGLPVVTTDAVARGLPAHVSAACDVTDEGEPFADCVVALLEQPPQERRARAASVDLASLSWPARLADLQSILSAAAAQRPTSA